MTRSMLASVLYRTAGRPDVVDAGNPFTDVKAVQWYTNSVLWENSTGVAEGYGNGLFSTNDPVTRAEVAAVLYRYTSLE